MRELLEDYYNLASNLIFINEVAAKINEIEVYNLFIRPTFQIAIDMNHENIYRDFVLKTIAESAAKLSFSTNNFQLIKYALDISEHVSDKYLHATTLNNIAEIAAQIGEKEIANIALEQSIKNIKTLKEDSKDFALKAITELYMRMGKNENEYKYLEKSIWTPWTINLYSKVYLLRTVAKTYSMIGKTDKSNTILEKLIELIDIMPNEYYSSYGLTAVVESSAKLGNWNQARNFAQLNITYQGKAQALASILRAYGINKYHL